MIMMSKMATLGLRAPSSTYALDNTSPNLPSPMRSRDAGDSAAAAVAVA
jgi:hypothetical protein